MFWRYGLPTLVVGGIGLAVISAFGGFLWEVICGGPGAIFAVLFIGTLIVRGLR